MRERNVIPRTGESPDPSPEYDPDTPLDIDPSHDWVLGTRWCECSRCAVRDYFPAAKEPCKVLDRSKSKSISKSEARISLINELRRFFDWWPHDEYLPSLADWAAEWFEWRRSQ